MKLKTVIPLILGVCVGGIAIKIVVDVVKNAEGATRANMTKCVVAKVDIGFAEEITPDKLMLKDWPKDSLPEEYFGNIEDLNNRVSSMFVPKDVPVYPSMLAQLGTPPGIQTRIKPGFRAVSLGIDEITGVAYQLKPGDRVDLISLVERTKSDGTTDFISRVILQNVEIAAIGRTLHTGRPGDAPKSVARSVTLLLKPEETIKLHLAQSHRGKISLALRGNTDHSTFEQFAGATNDQLLGHDASVQEEMFKPEPADPELELEPVKSHLEEPTSWIVTVVSGKDMRSVEYQSINGRWVRAEMPPAGAAGSPPPSPERFGGGGAANKSG